MKPFNFKYFIIALLRRGTFKFPFRNEAMKLAKVEYGRYKCNICQQVYWRREVVVDHVEPVVDVEGFVDWNTYIPRMFPCDVNKFQILCLQCHLVKSNTEKEEKRLYRQQNNTKVKKKLKKKLTNKKK